RIADEHNFVVTNTDEGLSYGWLTRDLISDRAYFRYHFLESSFWLMAVPMYLTPIHGACVNLGGKGVLVRGSPRSPMHAREAAGPFSRMILAIWFVAQMVAR